MRLYCLLRMTQLPLPGPAQRGWPLSWVPWAEAAGAEGASPGPWNFLAEPLPVGRRGELPPPPPATMAV